MADSVLSASIIATEALDILENNLVLAKLVHRGHESEFAKNVNGYTVGNTISIRRPTDFTLRTGATASVQDVTEGSVSLTVDKQVGVEWDFTGQEQSLNIKEYGERVLKPAMIQIVNKIDMDLAGLYTSVPNLVGTPGQVINSFADFAKAPERMDELSILSDGRNAVLAPTDFWGMLGSQTALYIQNAANGAYRDGSLGDVGGVSTYRSQNIATHTVGAHGGTPLVNGASQNVTYDSVKTTMTQSLVTDGWTNSITGILKAGDVFTIANVFAVNPVSKATLPFLRQFVVTADANSGATTGPATLTISPPIITSGAFQNCSAVPADNAAITVVTGTASTGYRQNLFFHKNAFALAMVPMVLPGGAADKARKSYNGISVRVVQDYDIQNDKNIWRLDVLYGVKAIDPRFAVRSYGT